MLRRADIPLLRLYNQRILAPVHASAAEVVSWMGAMQAQDYRGAKWSVGLRMQRGTEAAVEQAIADKQIVRTWPMRRTLHFVAAEDVRWMLELLGPRTLAAAASRRRQLEIDDDVLARSRTLLTKTLRGGKVLTRKQLCDVLDAAGISTAGQRGIHILAHLSQQAVLCFGPHEGKQPTFVLLDEWVPPAPTLPRDEALARLASRFVASHGPVTEHDLARWADITLGDAHRGLDAVRDKFTQVKLDALTYWLPDTLTEAMTAAKRAPNVFLLPGFDEYILGYKDRSVVVAAEHGQKVVPGNNGMFIATVVINGQAAGTWQRVDRAASSVVRVTPFVGFTPSELRGIEQAAECYGAYLGRPVSVQS